MLSMILNIIVYQWKYHFVIVCKCQSDLMALVMYVKYTWNVDCPKLTWEFQSCANMIMYSFTRKLCRLE